MSDLFDDLDFEMLGGDFEDPFENEPVDPMPPPVPGMPNAGHQPVQHPKAAVQKASEADCTEGPAQHRILAPPHQASAEAFTNAEAQVTKADDNAADTAAYQEEVSNQTGPEQIPTLNMMVSLADQTEAAAAQQDTRTLMELPPVFKYNPIADALPYFDQVQESFQLYRRCVNRRQMDTVLGKMLDDMEAVKVQSRGGMYFVPRQHMAKIDIFEDFLETMNEHALSENQVDVNSMYVVDNERQREKMAHEFYVALKKEIETYQERASHLINTGCESPTIMARWVSKIRELGEKRRRYEALFQRQISEVDGEFNTLQGFARELQVRIDHAHLKPLRSCA